MPKIRRKNFPPALLDHLLNRVDNRHIPFDQLILFINWIDLAPQVPDGRWFKRFSGMTVCGEGELVKTFLLPSQSPAGEEII
jgi:formate dehydrogenase maturation protein FdhE